MSYCIRQGLERKDAFLADLCQCIIKENPDQCGSAPTINAMIPVIRNLCVDFILDRGKVGGKHNDSAKNAVQTRFPIIMNPQYQAGVKAHAVLCEIVNFFIASIYNEESLKGLGVFINGICNGAHDAFSGIMQQM